MNKKKYLIGTEEEKKRLRVFIRGGSNAQARERAQAIFWSMEGRSRNELAALFRVKADTISSWMARYDPSDFSKLSDSPRPGRPPVLSAVEKKTFLTRP